MSGQERLRREVEELRERIERLDMFMSGSAYDELGPDEQADLRMQRVHMEDYLRVLNRRLRRALAGAG